ncbi:MAG TPA: GNAT family N-acetyltransferase, partial [Planctomycetota bacterium]|nr:GNAT family N-acetyltransferase [Planctomycetota bacterium]
ATVVTPLCAAGYETPEVQQALLRALGDKARADGVHMLQVFTSQDDARTHELLAQCGFEPLAVLLFMSRPVTPADRNSALDKQIRWIPYDAAHHETFVRVVGETYRDTLDCRKLGESRDPAETLAGYLARGEIDPSLWLVARLDDEDVACLLLVERSDENAYEVGYVGVVPAHRGKGLGRKVMERGLVEVSLRATDAVMKLAVDEENTPAVDMYGALGFTIDERRQVHVRLLATA